MTGWNVHHVGLSVSDLDRAMAFYVDGLGATVRHVRDGVENEYFRELVGLPEAVASIALLDLPGGGPPIELVVYSTPTGPGAECDVHRPGSAHLAILVPNIDRAVATLSGLGVGFRSQVVVKSVDPHAGMRFVYCRDFDGHLVELVERPRVPTRDRHAATRPGDPFPH